MTCSCPSEATDAGFALSAVVIVDLFESRNTAIRRRTTANMCEIKNIYQIPIFRPAMQDFFRAVM